MYRYLHPIRRALHHMFLPEGMDAVDDSRHVFSVVQVCRDRVEDLCIDIRQGVQNIHTHIHTHMYLLFSFRPREKETMIMNDNVMFCSPHLLATTTF